MQRKILLDGLFLEDPEEKAKFDQIEKLAIATVNACQDLDVNEFVSVTLYRSVKRSRHYLNR